MVTICHGCSSNLYQAYHRNQSSNKPQPAHEEIWPFAGLATDDDGYDCQQDNRPRNRDQGVALPRRRLNITDVSQQAEQAEESGQSILPFRSPGDRLHMQWVEGEKSRDNRALPLRTGYPPEE